MKSNFAARIEAHASVVAAGAAYSETLLCRVGFCIATVNQSLTVGETREFALS